MRLYFSTTSPYARIARVALVEKGLVDADGALRRVGSADEAEHLRGDGLGLASARDHARVSDPNRELDRISESPAADPWCDALPPLGTLTDPWRDDPGLVEAIPSVRVPTLVLDSGLPITESLLIVLWLETQRPSPSLLGVAPDQVISKAGVAMGAIDAAAAIIIGRRNDAGFDESPVGLRRRRSIVGALRRLEASPPRLDGDTADLAVITSVVLLDYIRFRFTASPWLPTTPTLNALAAHCRERPSFATTLPRDMPRG